jgi:hypothetical protein
MPSGNTQVPAARRYLSFVLANKNPGKVVSQILFYLAEVLTKAGFGPLSLKLQRDVIAIYLSDGI